MKRAIAVMVVLMLSMGCFLITPTTVSATELTFWSSASPPAYNCSYWTVYPRYSTGVTEVEGPKVNNDLVTQDLYGSTGVYKWVKTNDFTDIGSWVDPESNSSYIEPVAWMPPSDATITSVLVSASFTNYRPDMVLSFSVNNGSSWTSSSIISGSTEPFMGQWSWNVTTLATWTPALLNSTDVWARMKASPVTGFHYYLDYLGFVVYWWAEREGGGSGGGTGDPGTSESRDYSFVYTADGLIGIIGIIGFCGMIAIPALGIWTYRHNQGEGRLSIFVKMLVLFMFCLTCFMASIAM